MSASGGAIAASRSNRSLSGRSIRSSPSTCSRSKRNAVSGTDARAAARAWPAAGADWLAARAEVTWNGCGRPSARSATASPSITAALTRRSSAIATISGTRSVMSSSVLVKTRTRSPSRWIWILMPSIFHSSAAGEIFCKRRLQARCRGGEHRPHGLADAQRERPQRRDDVLGTAVRRGAERGLRDLGERSAQLVGPADLRGRARLQPWPRRRS